jgi:hypothetical protein
LMASQIPITTPSQLYGAFLMMSKDAFIQYVGTSGGNGVNYVVYATRAYNGMEQWHQQHGNC